jgi:hypothetical protein
MGAKSPFVRAVIVPELLLTRGVGRQGTSKPRVRGIKVCFESGRGFGGVILKGPWEQEEFLAVLGNEA